jgi:UDP-2,3-diacylglucosamine hydrolase
MTLDPLGIIAGSGALPLLVAGEARTRGHRILALAFSGFTARTVETLAHETVWIKLGQIDKAISHLNDRRISRVVMAGKIEKINLLRPWNLGLDRRALRIIRSLSDWRDDTILAAIAAELANDGIVVDEITNWAQGLMAARGVLTKGSPTEQQWKDIEFGRSMAQGIGALDIGQTVVVKNAAVIVVEAIEGTDRAIKRAGELGVSDAVVVKMAKPSQDMRFDVPGVGPSTIESMKEAKAAVLAVETGKTMITDCPAMIRAADKLKIAVVGIPPDGPVNAS